MANYLNAFYGATNAFCGVMTSATYANEIQGKNLISLNNKLLGPDGYKYHLKAGHSVWSPSYERVASTFDAKDSYVCGTTKGVQWGYYLTESKMRKAIDTTAWGAVCSPKDSLGTIKACFGGLFSVGSFKPANISFLHYTVSKKAISNATISQLVNYEASLAKGGASANTMKEWGQQIQAANTAFSDIKGQAQAGVSQVSGWVQTDGDEMTAAVNMLSSVLQGLASPVTVS